MKTDKFTIPLIAIRGNKDDSRIKILFKQLSLPPAECSMTDESYWYLPIISNNKTHLFIGNLNISQRNKDRLEELGYCFFDNVDDARTELNKNGFVV